MDSGNLEQILIFGIILGLLVTASSVLFVSFANSYGFNNATDPRFTALNQSQVFYDEIASARSTAQDTNPLLALVELIFQGGYFAVHSFLSLPNTLDTMVNNALSIFGLSGYSPFFWGIISIVILFAVLNGLGVFKRNS